MSTLNFIATQPNRLAMVPFAVLLLAITLGPWIAQHHWERHYHKLCLALAGSVCLYYFLVLKQPARIIHAGMEYVTFMVVVGSFFIVAGGIHLRAKAPSSPLRNTLFLFAGAVLGNLIGTIAASLLLIRPWIAMNRGRIAPCISRSSSLSLAMSVARFCRSVHPYCSDFSMACRFPGRCNTAGDHGRRQ